MIKSALFIFFTMLVVAYGESEQPPLEINQPNIDENFRQIYYRTDEVNRNAQNASNLSSGTIPSARLDASSVTLQGNTFNGANQLIQANSSSLVPNANIDPSSVTKQANTFNGATQLVQTNSSSFVPNTNLDPSSVTKQGNTFNGANQLIQANSSGLVPNDDLDSSSVTKQGNTFNAASKLVQLDSSGRYLNSTQPCFSAYNSATDSNITGDGTIVTVDFDTEVFDAGSNFSADTFTAPVTGKYTFHACVTFTGTASGNDTEIFLVTSNATYSKQTQPIGDESICISHMVDMDTSDTARIDFAVHDGSMTVDVVVSNPKSGTGRATFFSGCLLN